MSQALQIYTGNDQAPNHPDANRDFHLEILDRLYACARADHGWAGASFCWYRRQAGTVCIGIEPGTGWPDLADLRTFVATWTPPEEPEDFAFQGDGQGRMFG